MGIEGSLAGKRVVISTDGGRLRVRKNKRGQKTKKGRSRYHTDWREPKLLVIYVVNEQGRIAQEFAPVIDGTLQGPDEIFRLLEFYPARVEGPRGQGSLVHRRRGEVDLAAGARSSRRAGNGHLYRASWYPPTPGRVKRGMGGG